MRTILNALLGLMLLFYWPLTVCAVESNTNLLPIISLLLSSNDVPVTRNFPPTANAGANQSVTVGSPVLISGSASSDVNGDSLTYSWSGFGPAWTTVNLSSTTGITTSFTPGIEGTYIIQLVVNDGTADSAPDTVTITVGPAAEVHYGIVSDFSSDSLCYFNGDIGISGYIWYFNNCNIYGYSGNKLGVKVINRTSKNFVVASFTVTFGGISFVTNISPGSGNVMANSAVFYDFYMPMFLQVNNSIAKVSIQGIPDTAAMWEFSIGTP